MEVRPGYKQTEVGLIPEDWNALSLEAVCSMKSGEGITAVRIDAFSPFPCYGGNGIRGYTARFTHEGDHALIGRQGALCGNVVGTSGKFFASEHAVVVTPRAGTDIRFLTYVLGQMRLNRYSESSAQPGLSVSKVLMLPVATPPTKAEQRAIASVLSDVDALLGRLDRLIAKKRDLKQAAMQQLLTGQTRLPGFHREWEVKRVEELAEVVSGGTPRTNEPSYWNGHIKWCTPTDITRYSGKYLTETERTISRDGLNNSGAVLLPVGALLLCSRATIGELKIAATPICTNQGFKSLVCRPRVSNEFLYYKLLTMKQQMVERAFGSTFLEISTRNVSALEVATPSHDEQIAISAVLSDMDAELLALEARREKTRAVKQGMMQELLTGRTRLVQTGVAVA
jgi:type I restriction enzyme S subunit